VFTAVAVILVTLGVQGTTMPAVIRWAGPRGDPDEATEERRAHRQIVNAAPEVLPDNADRLDTPPETTDALLSELRQYAAEDAGPPDNGPGVRTGLELRRTLIGVKRSALISLRDRRITVQGHRAHRVRSGGHGQGELHRARGGRSRPRLACDADRHGAPDCQRGFDRATARHSFSAHERCGCHGPSQGF
jgi:hypothetical protein